MTYPNSEPLHPVTCAYLGCALWLSIGEDGETPLDTHYTVADFAPESVSQAQLDCSDFMARYGELAESVGLDASDVGHDFWLTRNRHGAGFWDRGLPKDVGQQLTNAAHAYGETDAYIGDDGKVYLS